MKIVSFFLLFLLSSISCGLILVYWDIGARGTLDGEDIVCNRTADECAVCWAREYNRPSIEGNVEMGSSIYSAKGGYFYTLPNIGDEMSVVPSDTGGRHEEVALVHSHAKAKAKKIEEYFSGEDYAHTLEANVSVIYVSTPEGKLRKGVAFGRRYHSTTFGVWFALFSTPYTSTTVYTLLPHDKKALIQYFRHLFLEKCSLC